MELILLDIALRGASTGILLILCSLIWVSRVARTSQLALTAISICLVARIWSTLLPGFELPHTVDVSLKMIGAWTACASTWFLVTIFMDDSRFHIPWILSATVVSMGVVTAYFWQPIVPYVRAYGLAHYLSLIVVILLSAKDDLRDTRRRARPVLCLIILLFSVLRVLTTQQMVGVTDIVSALTASVSLFVVVSIVALWALKANLQTWPGEAKPQAPREQKNPARAALIARIEDAMEAGIWRKEGLTISGLAQDVGAPEHRVRMAINQGLGYRNFSSFINQSRIEEARRRLRAPEYSEATVLEIAFSVGFSSLGPFNRAFRDATQKSPTEYRNSV